MQIPNLAPKLLDPAEEKWAPKTTGFENQWDHIQEKCKTARNRTPILTKLVHRHIAVVAETPSHILLFVTPWMEARLVPRHAWSKNQGENTRLESTRIKVTGTHLLILKHLTERQEPGGNFSGNWDTAGNQFCNLRCPASASSGGHHLEFSL